VAPLPENKTSLVRSSHGPPEAFRLVSQGKGGRILDRGRADCMVEKSITVDGMLTPFPLCATNYPGRAFSSAHVRNFNFF